MPPSKPIRFYKNPITDDVYVNLDDLLDLLYEYADSSEATRDVRGAFYGIGTGLAILAGHGEVRENPDPKYGSPLTVEDYRDFRRTLQQIREANEIKKNTKE